MGRKRPGCCQAGSCIPRSTLLARPRQAEIGEPDLQRASNISTCCFRSWNDSSRWGLRDTKRGIANCSSTSTPPCTAAVFFQSGYQKHAGVAAFHQAGKSATSFGRSPHFAGIVERSYRSLYRRALAGHRFRKSLVGLCRCIKVVRPRPSKISVPSMAPFSMPCQKWFGPCGWTTSTERPKCISIFDVLKGVPIDATLTPAACSGT